MTQRRKTATTIILLLVLFVAFQFVALPAKFTVTRLGQALQAPRLIMQSFAAKTVLIRNITALQKENASLTAQVVNLQTRPERIEVEEVGLIKASVYSRYLSSTASKLLINAGQKHGVEEGDYVFANPFIILGIVEKVEKSHSIVRTIFDNGWEIPVKIGAQNTDALLVSGAQPRLTTISKSKQVDLGDPVVSAGIVLPYGFTIGIVEEVIEQKEELFRQGKVRFPYNLSELSQVYIQPKE